MSTTARKAGPSFRRVVMSLKRIPSVGKSLMSRILARSSATFMPAPMVIDAPHTPQEPSLRTQRGAVMFALYHCGHGKEVRTPAAARWLGCERLDRVGRSHLGAARSVRCRSRAARRALPAPALRPVRSPRAPSARPAAFVLAGLHALAHGAEQLGHRPAELVDGDRLAEVRGEVGRAGRRIGLVERRGTDERQPGAPAPTPRACTPPPDESTLIHSTHQT